MQQVYGYTTRYNDEGEIVLNAPCGCAACNSSVQQGHFACDATPGRLLLAEQRGILVRSLNEGAWEWIVTRKGMQTTLPHI